MIGRPLLRPVALASLLAAATTAAAVPAAAQGERYQQQLQGYMNNYSQTPLRSGYQALGGMLTGGLNSSSSESKFISLSGGVRYYIIGVCDQDCSDVDLRLYTPDGSNLAQDIATDDHPTLNIIAPVSGQYRLQVEMASCRQSPCYYGVQIFAQGGMVAPMAVAMNTDSMGLAGSVGLNQQVTNNLTRIGAQLSTGRPIQSYSFTCAAGQQFRMDVLSSWDNYGLVYDPMGSVVARDDDSGEGLNARINYTCLVTGVHRLGITTYQSSTEPGQYTLQVQGMGQVAIGVPQPMGQPQPMAQPTPIAQPIPMAQPQAMAGVTMPTPVRPTMQITGTIPAPGAVGIVAVGQTVQGRLEQGDQQMNDGTWADVWQFQGTAGMTVRIELRSSEFDTYLQLLDAQGNRLAEDDDSLGELNSLVVFRLPASGMYQLVVNNFGDSRRAGLYTLTLLQAS